MTNVVEIRGAQAAPRSERSSMETLIITPEMVDRWQLPPFQRPLKVNPKVQKIAIEMKTSEVVPGIITLGRLKSSTALYLVDGQHRMQAFRLSELKEAIVDIRVVTFDSMAEMAEEFVELNSAIVKMQPDDILRGLESVSKTLRKIRAECGWVGYSNVRRNKTSKSGPILSMSLLIRCWTGSSTDTPSGSMSGRTASTVVTAMDDDTETTSHLIRFLHMAFEAWGRDDEYRRLWGGLNLTMSMWLYRRLVLDKVRGVRRYVVLNDSQFKQCLMSQSADKLYLDWLQGRNMSERDRNPCYIHNRRIFAKRLIAEGTTKALMPTPSWATISGGR